MTPKQAAYVMAYVENGGNGTRACAAAGYLGSDNALNQQSRDNLQIPTIRAELERLGALPAQRVAASLAAAAGSAAWIVDRAVALADGARQDRDKIQALALLARRHAEFRDSGPAVVQQIVALPPGTGLDDLRALAASMRGARAIDAPGSEAPQ